MFYSCSTKKHELGTGFVITKRIKHLVLDFKPVSPRLCYIRIKGKFFNYSLINVHAPIEDTSEEEKDVYYKE